MSEDKKSEEPKIDELSGEDLDQVQGGKKTTVIGGKTIPSGLGKTGTNWKIEEG